LATVAIVAIALSAALLELPGIGKPMFRDDAATLYSAHLPWGGLWAQSRVVDLTFLPYYALMHLWMEINGSVEWARWFSLLGLSLTVFLVGRLGLKLGGWFCGVSAAGLAAVVPLLAQQSLDVRPYTMTAAAVVASAIGLFNWLDSGERRWYWVFVAGTLIAGCLQVFSFLPGYAMLLGVLLTRSAWLRDRWRRLIVPSLVLGLGTIAVCIATSAQVGQISWVTRLPNSELFYALFGGQGGTPTDHVTVFCILIGATSLIVLVARPWRRPDAVVIAVLWAFLPSAVLTIASFVKPVFVDRYFTSSAPGFALLIALLGAQLWAGARRRVPWTWLRATLCAAPVLVAFWVGISPSVSATGAYLENFPAAAGYLRSHLLPHQLLAVPDHADGTAMTYYLSRDGVRPTDWPARNQPYIEGLALADPLALTPQPTRSVWLFQDGSTPAVTNFISELHTAGYVPVRSQSVQGILLLLFVHSGGPT
jgi:hypothetical protein